MAMAEKRIIMDKDKLRASAEKVLKAGKINVLLVPCREVIELLNALDKAESENIKRKVCISYLSCGVAKLWDSVSGGMHDARSLVGDTTLDMQENLMRIGIDARGVKALTQKGGE